MLWDTCLGAKRDGRRYIEIFRYSPDGTSVPKADSPDGYDGHHTRTIGPKGKTRKTWRYPLEPKVEKTRSRCPLGGMYSMKRSLLVFAVLIVIATAGVQPAAAQNGYVFGTTGCWCSV